MKKDMKLIMITGANKGIGLEVIRNLLKSRPEYKFFMCTRSKERGEAALKKLKEDFPGAESKITLHNLDISNSKSIDAFVDWVKTSKTKIDCLMNNAGVIVRTNDVTEEVINQIFPINYYGTIELTEKMLPLLPDGSKIIIITSELGTYNNLKDCPLKGQLSNPKLTREELNKIMSNFCSEVKAKKITAMGGWGPVYGVSKLALNHYVKILAQEKEIKDRGIQVYACHPGWVKTDLGGSEAPLTIEQGTVCPCFVINLPWKVDENYQGAYIADCKVKPI
jgi:NAD(P)-dependent dehydrogenase (short-subunit alcohol dehydrogenase family)